MWRTVLACVLAVVLAPGAFAEPVKQPNIVLLLTDDQRADCLSCVGHPHLKTPNLDRLAREGTLFPNAFVTTSICCVSRASIMTGKLCRHHGVGDFNTPLAPAHLAATFPAVCKKAGYRTGCFGKWGIGGPPPKDVFDVWNATGGQGVYFENVDGKQVHNSELLARRAEKFLREQPRDQPFCLVVLYKSPHDPYQPDPADAELFKDVTFARPKTFTPAHFEALPEFLRTSEARIRFDRHCPTPEKYQEFVRQYLRCVAGMDRSVGRILKVLDDLKLADDTIVVFSSDNGFCLGEHGLIEKWFLYEESIRVPLIVRYPRLPEASRGKRPDSMALNIDIAPTVLDLAGIAPPKGMDGRSLKPLMLGEKAAWREHFFYEHHYHHGGKIPRTEGVRTKDWKYVTYFDVKPAHEGLYDLKNDPGEERNLANEAGSRDKLEELRRLHQQEVRRLPPPVLPAPRK